MTLNLFARTKGDLCSKRFCVLEGLPSTCPGFRGIGVFQRFYQFMLPKGEIHPSVDDFDKDLKIGDLDVRETSGMRFGIAPCSTTKINASYFAMRSSQAALFSMWAPTLASIRCWRPSAARAYSLSRPIRTEFEMLRRNIRLNHLDDRVTVFPIAVGSEEGTVTLFRFKGNSGHSNLFSGTDPVEVSCKTIDSLDLPPIDVCKMDIEGSELSALKGMRATICRSPQMKLLIEYAEVLGASAELTDFIRAYFSTVYAIRQPPLRAKGPLSPRTKLPRFCDLWACRS